MSSTGALTAGTLVADRYHIEETLAGEGSAAIYRASDTRLDRAVALRVLSAADSGGGLQGKAAARLVHPNVARVLDFGTDVQLETDFVVADLGTGGSLAALLAQRGLPPLPLALRMIQEAAAGLAAAHHAGLVHGDLHPGVLWLSRDEGRLRVQVLGLGLSPAGAPPPRATARYASPERLRRARELSAAADVFSLGVIAYEVFAGLPENWNQFLLQMARGQAVVAPSLLETRPDLPAHVSQAVRQALAADPTSRWPDAGDFAAHLIADLASPPRPEAQAVPVPVAVSAPEVPSAPEPVVHEPAVPALAVPEIAPPPVAIAEAVPGTTAPSIATDAQAPVGVDEVAEDEADVSMLAEEAVRALANAAPPPDPASADADTESVTVDATASAATEPQPELERVVQPEPAEARELPTVAHVVPPAEPVAPAEPAPKATRQPLPAGRRGKPALASTDLADTLYIPPVPERPASAPTAALSESPGAAARDVVPSSVPAAPVEAVQSTRPIAVTGSIAGMAPAPPPESAADETVPGTPISPPTAVPAPVATADVAPQPDAPIALEGRRRGGLHRLGAPSHGRSRGLLAAGIAAAVLVIGGGAVAVRSLMAGGNRPPAQALAGPTASVPGAPGSQPGVVPATDSTLARAATDSAQTALTPGDQLSQDEERRRLEDQRRLEEQRRLAQRQQDSLRQAQLAAQTVAAAVPQQVALQNAPRPAAPTDGPRLEQRVTTAPPPAPAPAPARPASDPNRVYSADELDTRPSLANRGTFQSAVNRTYPGTLRGSNTWGSAVVSFVVLPDGRVDRSSVMVIEASQPAFRTAAVAAIANARFNPARVGGQAVRTTVSMPITWQGGGQDD